MNMFSKNVYAIISRKVYGTSKQVEEDVLKELNFVKQLYIIYMILLIG